MSKFIPGGPPRYRHQKRGLRKLLRTQGVGALLFDPGTGKTGTALDYLSIVALKAPRHQHEARVLVICPLVAMDTWIDQAEIFVSPQVDYWAEAIGGSLIQRAETLAARGGNPFRGTIPEDKKFHARALNYNLAHAWSARAEGRRRPPTATEGPDGVGYEHTGRHRLILEVLNFDTFSSRQRYKSGTMADLMLNAVKRFEPDVVVIDESHRIKSASSNVSRLMSRISEHVPRRILLTGTPMPTGPLDVFGQWRFLDPYAFGVIGTDGSRKRSTFGSFKERFAVQGGYMGREVVGFQNLDELQRIMGRRAVVARKEDALDLPDTTDVVVPVHLTEDEKQAYDQMKSSLAATLPRGTSASVQNVLSQIMRLRQITSGHLPDDNGTMHLLGGSKVKAITSMCTDTLAGENRIVIFCLFSKEIEMLSDALRGKGTEVMVIQGGTPAKERMRLRQRFGSDDPQRMILVAQIKTLSLAVNELVTASHAIFGSLSHQRDDLVQARDRLHRIGQTRPCTFWYMISPGTVDEVIYASHQQRTDLENAVLAHIHGEETVEVDLGSPLIPDIDREVQRAQQEVMAAQ